METKLLLKINKLDNKISISNKKLTKAFSNRLITGVLIFILSFAQAVFQKIEYTFIPIIILILFFLYYFIISSRLKRFVSKAEKLKKFYFRQRLKYKGESISENNQNYLKFDHNDLSFDLDILSQTGGGLLSFLDECFTFEGVNRLYKRLVNPQYSKDKILEVQSKIKKLSLFSGYLRRIKILSEEYDINQIDQSFIKYIQAPLLEKGFNFWFKINLFFYILAMGTLIISFLNVELPVTLFFVIYLFIFIYSSKNAESAFSKSQNIIITLQNLIPILKKIENLNSLLFTPEINKMRFSQKLNQFERIINKLSIQTHALVYYLVNLIFPWTFFWASRAEDFRKNLPGSMEIILDEMHEFEFLMSLSFVYKYQTQTFPSFNNEFEFKQIYHPLISIDKRVNNDFKKQIAEKLYVITGSNMSGKSTFLRSVGISQLLSQIGSPVFCSSMSTQVMTVQSCIRITDSLSDQTSYFYAEIKRLKALLVHSNNNCLILIDEIYKGTNNKERLIGGKAILLALKNSKSLSFVTTHDLDLAINEKEISHYHFVDNVVDGKMSFDYKIKSGICPSTNALKIMEKEGLPI